MLPSAEPWKSSSAPWLLAYFVVSLVLTLHNKFVLARSFPFPYHLTAVHALSSYIGSLLCLRARVFSTAKLTTRDSVHIVLFSTLYTINIIVSNVSLHLVTVPFHQIIRSTTPLFVILISLLFYAKSFPKETYISLVPVVVGVALATAGDYYFTPLGFVLTLLGTLLAAVKTILTNRLQKHASTPVHPLDLLLRMSPLAFAQSLGYAAIVNETDQLRAFLWQLAPRSRWVLASQLALNGLVAFGVNYVSFAANKKTSPLTMTVAANLKQCLSIILGVWVFQLQVGWMNALGIIIALTGGAWYARIELDLKTKRQSESASAVGVEKEVV